jgi:hypothetical protein
VLYFHTAVYTGMEITGELTWSTRSQAPMARLGSRAKSRSGAISSRSSSACRGRAARSGGTTYLTKLLQIDVPFVWDSFEKIGDIDGNDIRVFKFTSKYNQLTNVGGRGTVTIVRQGTSEFSGA